MGGVWPDSAKLGVVKKFKLFEVATRPNRHHACGKVDVDDFLSFWIKKLPKCVFSGPWGYNLVYRDLWSLPGVVDSCRSSYPLPLLLRLPAHAPKLASRSPWHPPVYVPKLAHRFIDLNYIDKSKTLS